MYTSNSSVPDLPLTRATSTMLRKFRKDATRSDTNGNHLNNDGKHIAGCKHQPPSVQVKAPPAVKPKPVMGLSKISRPASMTMDLDYSVQSGHAKLLTDHRTTYSATHHRPLAKSVSHTPQVASSRSSNYCPKPDGSSNYYPKPTGHSYYRGEGVRTVVLARTKKGYGFVLRGAKGKNFVSVVKVLKLISVRVAEEGGWGGGRTLRLDWCCIPVAFTLVCPLAKHFYLSVKNQKHL